MDFDSDEKLERDENGRWLPDHGVNAQMKSLVDSEVFKNYIQPRAEDYVAQVEEVRGGEGHYDVKGPLRQQTVKDCWHLALTDYRISRIEGTLVESFDEYFDAKNPDQNLQVLFNRRERLLNKLGINYDYSDGDDDSTDEPGGFLSAIGGK